MPSYRKFVAQASNELSVIFFARHGIDISLEEQPLPSAQLADIVQARVAESPLGTANAIDQEIDIISKMATEAGENAITDKTLHDHLGSLPSATARALWVYLNDPDGFRRAEEVVFHDSNRYGRQWSAFEGVKGRDIRTDPEAKEAFREALKVHFDTANVHLDIFERSRLRFDGDADSVSDELKVDLVQVTIYREARPTVEPAFVDNLFTFQTRSPVIEAAVTYEPASGRIECVASQRANRKEVVRQFALALLGTSPDCEPCIQKSYDLSVLSEPITFDIDDGDCIEHVGVTMLRLKPIDAAPERITIDRLVNNERDIWQIAAERLGHKSLAQDYQISHAQIAIRWRAHGENRRRTLRVGMTHPYRSDIKEKTEMERLVAAKYLPRWGLVVGTE